MAKKLAWGADIDVADAGELREAIAQAMSDGEDWPNMAYALNRLASLMGDLPAVLRDLASDVENIRDGGAP